MRIGLRFLFVILLISSLLFSLNSCSDGAGPGESFDRTALLTNYSNNLIIPRYQTLVDQSNALSTAVNDFTAVPNLSNLQALRATFQSSYLAWQACSFFEFGPAADVALRTYLNTFPTDTALINSNISAGGYNLDAASNIDATGFPAMDFLLFGTGNTEQDVLPYFNQQDSIARRQYLIDISDQIQMLSTNVLTNWQNSYGAEFISRNGTDVGSSLSLLINEMNRDYERFIRDGKVGIPLGVRSLGTPQLDKIETPYSQISIELATESLNQMQTAFNGISPTGIEGLGLNDYLDAVGASHNGEDLSVKINDQFQLILTELSNLNEPFQNEILNNKPAVQSTYDRMQQLVVYFKVDMTSALGILITYQDSDGD